MQDFLLTAGIHPNYLSRGAFHVTKVNSHWVITAVAKLSAREKVTTAMAVKNVYSTP